MWVPVSLSAVCVLATGALVAAERAESRALRYAAKPIAAASFVAVAVVGGAAAGSAYSQWIVIGLILGAAGDIGLMLPEKKHFVIGLILFWLGHIAYLIAIAQIAPPASWLTIPGLIPMALGAAVGVYVWPHARALRPVVIPYIIVFVVVAMAALSALRLGTLQTSLLAAGAGLFFLSDIAVARHRFVAKQFVNKLLGQPAYFVGQLLIAWSAIC